MQRYRSYVLPIAIVLGIFFHHFFAQMHTIVPFLIAIMLFFTYIKVDIKSLCITGFHLWLLFFQVVGSLLLYLAINPFNDIIGQGVLVTVLTPTATAAVVVATMLGATLSTMVTYNLCCNLIITFIAPLYFSFIGIHQDYPFMQSFSMIALKIAPILLLPFLLAILFRFLLPEANRVAGQRSGNITFYLWSVALIIVVGRTIDFIFAQTGNGRIIIVMAAVAIVLCVAQFSLGRYIGRKYGDTVAGGQSLGQKNTVFAIWMAQTYLEPISSVLPAIYVAWQNIFNSYQLYKQDRILQLKNDNKKTNI